MFQCLLLSGTDDVLKISWDFSYLVHRVDSMFKVEYIILITVFLLILIFLFSHDLSSVPHFSFIEKSRIQFMEGQTVLSLKL